MARRRRRRHDKTRAQPGATGAAPESFGPTAAMLVRHDFDDVEVRDAEGRPAIVKRCITATVLDRGRVRGKITERQYLAGDHYRGLHERGFGSGLPPPSYQRSGVPARGWPFPPHASAADARAQLNALRRELPPRLITGFEALVLNDCEPRFAFVDETIAGAARLAADIIGGADGRELRLAEADARLRSTLAWCQTRVCLDILADALRLPERADAA